MLIHFSIYFDFYITIEDSFDSTEPSVNDTILKFLSNFELYEQKYT